MTTLNQRIQAVEVQQGAAVRAYEAILATALTENRDISDAEQLALDERRGELDSLNTQRQRLQEAEAVLARTAIPVPAVIPADRPASVPARHIEMRQRNQYAASDFVRCAIAMMIGGPWNAASYARSRWGDDELADMVGLHAQGLITRAPTPPMMGNEASGGGNYLIRYEQMGSQFIEMLRPQLIAARMPSMRMLEFNNAGQLLIPRQTSGVAGGYVGEGGTIRVQRLNFGQLPLVPSKLAVIVPTSNELLRRSEPSIEMLIRDDMLRGTAETIDRAFFSTTAAVPGGAPAGILNGIGQAPGGGIVVPPEDEEYQVNRITENLKAMIYALRRANVPMTAPVWIMNVRTMEFLRLLRTVQEVFAFKGEIDGGTLLGYPIVDTTNIPIPFPPGTGVQTAYALIDSSQVIWANDMAPIVDASEHATIQSEDPPPDPLVYAPPSTFSAWQNDMVFMRIRMSHTWARRHDVAVAWALTVE